MSGDKGYVISFAVFFIVLLVVLSVMQLKSFERRTFNAEVLDEIDANKVYIARQVINSSYQQAGPENYADWTDAVREYCLLEGLSCGIEQTDGLKVKVQSKRSRAEFRLEKPQ